MQENRTLFSKSGHFFSILKKGQERPPPPPPGYLGACTQKQILDTYSFIHSDNYSIHWGCPLLPSKHSSWWRRLEDVFCLRLQKTSSRRLQDVLIKTNTFGLVIIIQDVDDDTHSMEITVHWVLMWFFSYQTPVTWHLVPSIMTSSLYLIRKFYRMVSNLVPLRIKYEASFTHCGG